MGLFAHREQTISVYNYVDKPANGTEEYPETADLTFSGHIIKVNQNDINVLAEIINTHEVNPTGDYTTTIKKNAKLVTSDNREFKVLNIPYYLEEVNCTKLELLEGKNG